MNVKLLIEEKYVFLKNGVKASRLLLWINKIVECQGVDVWQYLWTNNLFDDLTFVMVVDI